MKSVQEALEAMMPAFAPLGVERVAIGEANGRVLGERVFARQALPAFDHSSMDGYAVRSADTAAASAASPLQLPIAGESRAGGPLPPRLTPGAAIRIFTGAPLPQGADAIVIQEDVVVEEGAARIAAPAAPAAWVRARGSDLDEGALMSDAGARVGPGEIGLFAAQGISAVSVFARPRVAILSTGDELRDLHEPERPGSIVNSNAYALAALVRDAGAEPWVLPNVRDDMQATLDAVRAGLAADVLITCGGVSVGDHDLVKEAFDRVGIEAGFWKVRIKPGKPLTFGLFGKKAVIGLPGNPMSAMVTFEALVRPGIRAMLGDARPYRARHEVELAVDHRHATGRVELARASVTLERGRMKATPHRLQAAGSLPSWVGVDALLLLPEDRATFAAGERVAALLLRDETGSARSPFADPL